MSLSPTPPPSSPRPSPSTPARDAVALLLRRSLRVSISDGRVFLGTFVGTDAHLNVLLVSTHEFRPGAPPSVPVYPGGRFVGQIMVPWRLVRKIEAEGRVDSEDDLDELYT
jgi:small nuclear ribonucleoprotein (snRNP)-like protein